MFCYDEYRGYYIGCGYTKHTSKAEMIICSVMMNIEVIT